MIPENTFIPREVVAERFAISQSTLARFEKRGLVATVTRGDVVGYQASQLRRIWSVVSLHRDLGINLAGVEAVLKLRDELAEIYRRLDQIAIQLNEAADHVDRQ